MQACLLSTYKRNQALNNIALWDKCKTVSPIFPFFFSLYFSMSLIMSHSLISFINILSPKGSLLDAAHLLGLAAFVVHLHESMSHSPLVQLVPPILPMPVPIVEALSSALVCNTHDNMIFCVRWGSVASFYNQNIIVSVTHQRYCMDLVAIQVVCGSSMLRYLQRKLAPSTTTAGLRPQQPLQEGFCYSSISHYMKIYHNLVSNMSWKGCRTIFKSFILIKR